jgi:hypothetical protein
MASNLEERKDAGMSATTVLNMCPRRVILEKEHDYHEPPSRYWARFRGTIGHLMMEHYDDGGEGIVQEVRFKKSVMIDGVSFEITGKADHIDTVNKYILDYKSIESVNRKPFNEGGYKPEHAQQLAIYRWLTSGGINMDTNEVVDYGIESGAILYFDMKAPLKVGVPLMSLEETEAFIIERLRPHVHYANTVELPDLMRLDNGKRHYFCGPCPLREVCDQRWEEDHAE